MIPFFQIISDPFSEKNKLKQNIISKAMIDIITYVCFFVTYIIFKLFNLRFISSPLEALGHQVIDLECFMHEYKNTKYKIIILNHEKFIANKFFFKYQKKKFKNFILVNNKLLCIMLHYVKRRFKLNLSINTQRYLSNNTITADKILNNLFLKKKKLYKISFSDKFKALAILRKKKIFINKNSSIITIHTRDKKFKAYDSETYRVSNIKTYYKSIDYLLSKNFIVFRLGIISDDKAKISKKNYYDLTKIKFSRYEVELITTYLISESQMFIGSCSGVIDLATIFDIPTLATNHAPLSHLFSHGRKKICLPKLYRYNRRKKILKFTEIIKNNYDNFRLDKYYKNHNLSLIDNTDIDILMALKELILNIKKKNFKPNKLQIKFRSMLKKNSHSIFSKNHISASFIHKYKKLM